MFQTSNRNLKCTASFTANNYYQDNEFCHCCSDCRLLPVSVTIGLKPSAAKMTPDSILRGPSIVPLDNGFTGQFFVYHAITDIKTEFSRSFLSNYARIFF